MKVKWKQLGLGAGLGGLVVVVAVVSLPSLSGQPQTLGVMRWVACSSCGEHYRATLAERPAKCPKCGKATIWPAMRCTSCGAVVAMDTFRFDRERKDPYCPKCGSIVLEIIDPKAAEIPPAPK
jgi:predicted RNA-binding Zn-ribbon protein involved in translation (DUF1610 family)